MCRVLCSRKLQADTEIARTNLKGDTVRLHWAEDDKLSDTQPAAAGLFAPKVGGGGDDNPKVGGGDDSKGQSEDSSRFASTVAKRMLMEQKAEQLRAFRRRRTLLL